MNKDHADVHVHRLEDLVVIVDDGAASAGAESLYEKEGVVTVRGDELQVAEQLHKVAEVLESKHMEEEASQVREHVRELVAKQLNEFDGFDR